jgi:integrase
VFASEFGTPVDPRNILRTAQIAAQKAGMYDIGVHTLRHSAAVAWPESGLNEPVGAPVAGYAAPRRGTDTGSPG